MLIPTKFKIIAVIAYSAMLIFAGYRLSNAKYYRDQNTLLSNQVQKLTLDNEKLGKYMQENEIKYGEEINKLKSITCDDRGRLIEAVKDLRQQIIKLSEGK